MLFPPPFTTTGRTRPLTVPRTFLVDFMHFAKKMPLVGISRRMDLGPVVAAKRPGTASWVLLFAKAFARVAADRPELRRAYMPWPWAHLFECDDSVANVALEREYDGEPMVLFAPFKNPHATPLAELARQLQDFKTKPLEELEPLHRTIRITKLPKLIRRALWVHALYQSGRIKAQNFGTFGISSVASAGVTTVGMASLLTSTLSFGPLDAAGRLDVRLDFDHRVYDGVPAAKALAEVERVLRTEIAAELTAMK